MRRQLLFPQTGKRGFDFSLSASARNTAASAGPGGLLQSGNHGIEGGFRLAQASFRREASRCRPTARGWVVKLFLATAPIRYGGRSKI